MPYVNVVRGVGARSPFPVRHRRFARGFQERARHSRGIGQTLADVFTTKGQLQRDQMSDTAYADSAVNYPEAPTCNVVDLSRNMCAYDNGLLAGCNAIQDCDPLTGAIHGQYGLPGGPIQGQPSTLRTVGPAFQFPVYGYSPNLALKNPTSTPTPVVFQSDAQIQANIQKALGPTLYKSYQAAQGIPSSSSPSTGGSGGGSPSSSSGGASSGGSANGGVAPPSPGFDLSFLTKSISLFGFNIPTWLLVAGGGGLLYAFGSKR